MGDEVVQYYKKHIKDLEKEQEMLVAMFFSGNFGIAQREFISQMQSYSSQISIYNKRLKEHKLLTA